MLAGICVLKHFFGNKFCFHTGKVIKLSLIAGAALGLFILGRPTSRMSGGHGIPPRCRGVEGLTPGEIVLN